MRKLTFPSYAKLNLYLQVLSKRPDKFHNIKTLFERIDLSDTLSFTLRKDPRINVFSDSPQLPRRSSRNLAYRSASILQERFGVRQGVDIGITKRIPVGAGMGGGSSNAATTLLALNKLWKLGLPRRTLLSLAAEIGSDVPFFIHDTPFAEAGGRGEKVRLLPRLSQKALWHVIAVPRVKVLTPRIYRGWDELAKKAAKGPNAPLTTAKYSVRIPILALEKNDKILLGKALFNSLQQVTCGLYPEVGRIAEALRAWGAELVLMSGSGPAVFCICSSRKEAFSLVRRISENKTGWRVFAARTR